MRPNGLRRLWLIVEVQLAASFVDITQLSHQPQRAGQAWLHSGKFQGDINIDPALLRAPADDPLLLHNAVRNSEQTWPAGEIPYVLDASLSLHERQLIRAAFASFHNATCIRFRRKKRFELDYLNIIKGKGCYSQIGRTKGKQELSLGRGCHEHQTIIHELMHAVGFWHEHSRADRDDNVKINWSNILPEAIPQFEKLPRSIQDLLDEPYDYFSVMHYEATAFATNARYSIESLDPRFTDLMGTGSDLSPGDAVKINKLYNCHVIAKDTQPREVELETPPPERTTSAPELELETPGPEITGDPDDLLGIFEVE